MKENCIALYSIKGYESDTDANAEKEAVLQNFQSLPQNAMPIYDWSDQGARLAGSAARCKHARQHSCPTLDTSTSPL